MSLSVNLLKLVAKLTVDSSEYDFELKKSADKAHDWGSKLSTGLKVAAGAVAVIGAAAGTAAKSFINSAGSVAEYGDSIDKMSQKMGISAEAYQEWEAVMQHSGTSMESLKMGMKTLASAVESGNDAFDRLGITQEEIASMSQEELFDATIAALQGVENETERTYLAGQLLGRGATELGPLLNTTAEETQAMKDRVHELGGVMSNEAVKAAAAYQDSLQDMTTAFSGLKNNLMSKFLPSMVTVMDGLGNIFSGNSNEGLGQVEEGINQFSEQLSQVIPKVIEVGSKIVKSLAQAIVTNLPVIFEAGVNALTELLSGIAQFPGDIAESAKTIIMTFVNSVVDNLSTIFDAAVEIIFAIVDGIIDSLPELIPAVVEVILIIVDKLTEPSTLMKLIDAAFQIIGAIAQGLINAIPVLVEKAPTIIMNLVEALLRLLPQLLAIGVQLVTELASGILRGGVKTVQAVVEVFASIKDGFLSRINDAMKWGQDLIDNFVNGIKSKFNSVRDAMSSFGSMVKSYIHFSEPDIGPLSDFSTYAPDMMKTFADGIKANEGMLRRQIASSFDFGDMINTPNMEYGLPDGRRTSMGGVVINVYGAEGQSAREIAEEVSRILTDQELRREAVYA